MAQQHRYKFAGTSIATQHARHPPLTSRSSVLPHPHTLATPHGVTSPLNSRPSKYSPRAHTQCGPESAVGRTRAKHAHPSPSPPPPTPVRCPASPASECLPYVKRSPAREGGVDYLPTRKRGLSQARPPRCRR